MVLSKNMFRHWNSPWQATENDAGWPGHHERESPLRA
jgi:hypothetical protein